MRSIVATLSLIVLFAALILFHRTQLINWFAPHLFSRAGLHNASLKLTDLGMDRVRIDRFSATIILPSGPLDIQIDDLVCHYHFRGVLHGKIETITATVVDITLPSSTADDPSPWPDLFLFDPVELLQHIEELTLPIEQLRIKNLQVHQNGTTIALLHATATATGTEKQLSLAPATNSDWNQVDQANLFIATDTNRLTATLLLNLSVLPILLPQFEVASLPDGMLQADLLLHAPPGIEPQLSLEVTGADLQHPLLSATEMQLQLNLARQQAGEPLLLSPASTLTIRSAKSGEISLAALTANLTGHINVHPATEPETLHLQLQPTQPWKIDGLETGGLRFTSLQIADILADLYLEQQQLRFTASCAAPQGTGSIAMAVTQQLAADQQGTASLWTDGFLIMTAENNLLHMLYDPDFPLTLDQGQIKMTTQWAWSRTTPVEALLDIDLAVGQGQIAEVPFTGLTVKHRLQLLPHVASSQPGLIRVDQMQGPVVPMENLCIRAGLDPPEGKTPSRLRIEKAEVELLGGRIELEKCLYTFNQAENSCLVTIREMDMQRIVAMQKVEGLTVDGRIEGHLPLIFTARGIQVNQGRLEQVGQGGLLRYRPPGGAPPGSPLTDYALKALEEFHYQQLTAQVEYIPDGTLIIALQLQGRSPNIKPDRPLHFNVTIEQNLLSLLRSLQYSQNLPGALHREIRR